MGWGGGCREQHLWPGFLTVCGLPLSLCLEAGALGAQTGLAKVSQVTNVRLQRACGRQADLGMALVGSNNNGYHFIC